MNPIQKAAATMTALGAIAGGTLTASSFFATADELKAHEEKMVVSQQQYQLTHATMQIDDLLEQLDTEELSESRRASKERQLRYWQRQELMLMNQLTQEKQQ